MNEKVLIGPQPGPQTAFLSSKASIALYGGAAGGGKSFGLLLEPLRHWNRPDFGTVIFRRSSVQVRNEGGLWDESMKLYGPLQAHPVESLLEWTFPKGSNLKFSHLEHDKTVFDWQGSQIPLMSFDELTHFTEKQFWYMLSRNRSSTGIPGYIRATCNPDFDSWVRQLVDWWIGDDGFPISERAGKLRWFIRQDEQLIWANTREELIEKYGKDTLPKSFTFIPSKLQDNKILMQKDPAYLANLKALSRVERMRLLEGNWNVRASAGAFFQQGWFEVVEAIPAGYTQVCRYWDRAATKPNESNRDPDWTRGLKMYKYPNNTFIVGDLRSAQDTPLNIEQLVKNTASFDGYQTTVFIEQDPGSSGVADAGTYTRLLSGFDVRVTRPTKAKDVRAKGVSAQSEAGNIKILKAPWNKDFFTELENFPEGSHDDIVDVFSGAFNELCGNPSLFDVL